MTNTLLILTGQYEEVIKSQQQDYETLVLKAISFQNLGQFEESYQLLEAAIQQDSNRFEAYYFRGQLNFKQGKVGSAQVDLEHAQKIQNIKSIAQLLEKVNFELKQNPKLQLSAQEKQQNQERIVARTDIVSTTGNLLYRWYQTDVKVGIEIHFSLPSKDLLICEFGEKKLTLSFPISADKTFDLDLDLFSEINVQESKTKVGLNLIEIIMDKKVKSLNWPKLEIQHNETVPIKIDESQAKYPTSSLKKKDWSKIDKEIDEDIQKHKEEYGEDPLSSLFKQIYQNGDEETRRAMIKSMQTSNGTVLSTNWSEVKEKDYAGKDRPEPPKGQELKKL